MEHETSEINNVSGFKLQASYHRPVLLKEAIKFLDPKPGEFIIDGTIDGGGHAEEILNHIGEKGTLLGIDWDKDMVAKCRARLGNRKNVFLEHGNYADIVNNIENRKFGRADGLLLDLGFSSEQLEESGRGFSFLKNEPLVMTYDKLRKPVKEILKDISEAELAEIIKKFGEERFANKIARAIKAKEKIKPIETTGELAETVEYAVPGRYERGRIHPATRTFQALRIYANNELGNLQKLLDNLTKILKNGGRVVIISFHSLEDGLVKKNFRRMEKENKLKIITKKIVKPVEEEIIENPRSRSAKLRAATII